MVTRGILLIFFLNVLLLGNSQTDQSKKGMFEFLLQAILFLIF